MPRHVKKLLVFLLLAASLFAISYYAGSYLFSQPQPLGKVVSVSDLPIRESNHRLGGGNGVMLVVFSDFQCSACQAASTEIEKIVQDFHDRVTLVYKHYPLPRFENSLVAAQAAEAAGVQGQFWGMHDMLYNNQADWIASEQPSNYFQGYARELALDLEQFQQDMVSEELQQIIKQDVADGQLLEILGTPTIYVNGSPLPVNPNYKNLRKAIELELR